MRTAFGLIGLFIGSSGLIPLQTHAFQLHLPFPNTVYESEYEASTLDDAPPPCFNTDRKTPLPIMNTQVMQWQRAAQNNFSSRALVTGVFTTRYPDQTGHAHFAIDLDGDKKGDLEVIYQNDFGALPALKNGDQIAACGDYITDPKGSKNGGIIHWIHSNDGARDGGTCVHPDGYLAINGVPYGITPPDQRHCNSGTSI